nr:hypothetical protein [Nanoarchaeum sp.]
MEAPQIVVVSIIVKDNKVLLVKRAREPFKEYWSIIGGLNIMKEKYSSDPLQASKEEVNCDLNCEFVNPKFFTYSYNEEEKPTICLYFYGQIKGNITINTKYISEYKWFSIEEIKDLELAFGHKEMLLRFFEEGG